MKVTIYPDIDGFPQVMIEAETSPENAADAYIKAREKLDAKYGLGLKEEEEKDATVQQE